jgi:hypothetical protein
MLAESLDRGFVGQFRQHAAIDQRAGEIIGDRLLARQIVRSLPGDDGGELFVRQPS